MKYVFDLPNISKVDGFLIELNFSGAVINMALVSIEWHLRPRIDAKHEDWIKHEQKIIRKWRLEGEA